MQKMLPNLSSVLVNSLTKCVLEEAFKDSCYKNIAMFGEKMSVTEFTVKEITVCRVAVFLKEDLHQTDFLRYLRKI